MDHSQTQNININGLNRDLYPDNKSRKLNGLSKIPHCTQAPEQGPSYNNIFLTTNFCHQTKASTQTQPYNKANGIIHPNNEVQTQPKCWGIKLSLNLYFQSENFRAFTALISEYKKSIPFMDTTSPSTTNSNNRAGGAQNYHNSGSGLDAKAAAAKAVYHNIQGALSTAADRVETYPAYRSLRDYARVKPYQTFVAGTVFAFTLLPIAMFLTFMVGSFCFTFFGFILIEGTLLSIATLIAGFVIFWVGSFALCVAMFALTAYVMVSRLLRFIRQNLPSSQARARSILKRFQPTHSLTDPHQQRNNVEF